MSCVRIDGTVWRQDVATRACTGMCAVWRVPAMRTQLILRNTTNFKLSQYLRLPALAMAVVFWYKVALCAAWNLFGLPSSITCK